MKWYEYERFPVLAEMRPYEQDEDLSDVSVGFDDIEHGSPKVGDMIARDPNNHGDMWLVNESYFKDKFKQEPVGEVDN